MSHPNRVSGGRVGISHSSSLDSQVSVERQKSQFSEMITYQWNLCLEMVKQDRSLLDRDGEQDRSLLEPRPREPATPKLGEDSELHRITQRRPRLQLRTTCHAQSP